MTLNVIDIASYQKDLVPSKLSADAIIVKATQSTNYVNPTWKTQAQQTLDAGKKLGLYHFVQAGINGATQADYFLNQAAEFVGKAILILDFENEGTKSNVRNADGLTIAKAFLDRVYNQTGVRPLIYTNTDFEQHLDFSAIVKGNYGLWIAQYRTMDKLNGFQPHDYPYKLVHWPSLTMYQYSSNTVVPGYGAGIDVSIFYGDGSAWDAYAKASKAGTPTTVAQSAATAKPAETPKPVTGAIADVQTWLNKTYGTGLAVDNLNGPATKRSLAKAIQTEINRQFGGHIAVDGIFGSGSKAAFKTIRRGAQGNMTRIVQGALICKGYSVNGFDGIFGGGLQSAIQKLQRNTGISVDGVVGPDTAYKLFA